MTFTLGWLILAFVAGAFAMLALVVLFASFIVGRAYDAHMMPVHDDDDLDDDWDDDDVEAAYMQDELLVGQRVER